MEIPPEFRGAVLVAAGDEVVLEHYAGFADARDALPCTASTRFQLASVSKQFVAACVLLLAEKRRLSVDDVVGRWFDHSPPSWNTVSLHHLMTHTAGFGHFPDYGPDLHTPIDDAELLRRLQHQPLPNGAPRPWYYSSPAYGLVARVVERASGTPYRDFLDQHIFRPLAMDDTFAGNGNGRPDLAAGYMADEPVPSMELDTLSMGAGDIWSTVRDLDRWNVGILSGRLLSPESRAQMFAPYADIDGFPVPAGYGYGWMIATVQDQQLCAHSGDNVGYSSLNVVAPVDALRIVILTNEQTADLLPLAMTLLSSVGA